MDIAVRYVIVPGRHLYWVEAVDPHGSRRAIEVFRDEGSAVERLRSLQSHQEKMELRWHAPGFTVLCGWQSRGHGARVIECPGTLQHGAALGERDELAPPRCALATRTGTSCWPHPRIDRQEVAAVFRHRFPGARRVQVQPFHSESPVRENVANCVGYAFKFDHRKWSQYTSSRLSAVPMDTSEGCSALDVLPAACQGEDILAV
jgi:hypothetical protein